MVGAETPIVPSTPPGVSETLDVLDASDTFRDDAEDQATAMIPGEASEPDRIRGDEATAEIETAEPHTIRGDDEVTAEAELELHTIRGDEVAANESELNLIRGDEAAEIEGDDGAEEIEGHNVVAEAAAEAGTATDETNDDSRYHPKRRSMLDIFRGREAALTISVRDALRTRGDTARNVILEELNQMIKKSVWTPVYKQSLTTEERSKIIRSSMFLKEKFLASGEFDKLKARLVAGGNMQDRELYEDLSAPTASTCSVFAVLAIAAREERVTYPYI